MSIIRTSHHDFSIVSPPDMPWDERDTLVHHLVFSMYIKEVWKRGDAIIEGIYAKKRNRKRLLTNRLLRLIVRTIRRFAKFDTLRSTLEGLLFEQSTFLNTPTKYGDYLNFQLKGHRDVEFNLTQVYFNASAWECNPSARECNVSSFNLSFDDGDHVTPKDVAHLLLYFGMLDYMLKEIKSYLYKHVRGKNYWKHKTIRFMSSIQKSQRYVSGTLLEYLKHDCKVVSET